MKYLDLLSKAVLPLRFFIFSLTIVFCLPTVAWQVEQAKLTASDDDAGDELGKAVSLADDLALVGARYDDEEGSNAGAAYLFDRDYGGADNWGEILKLTGSDTTAGDLFGSGVWIQDEVIAIGAPGEDSEATNAGAAYIFKRNQGGADQWGEFLKLTADDAQTGDQFGKALAIDSGVDTIVVGARFEDTNGSNAGAAYVFSRNQGGTDNWGQVAKLTADGGAAGDRFGMSVAISGDLIAVGAWRDDTDTGSIYLFARDEGGQDNWGQLMKLRGDDSVAEDEFGKSVALEDDRLLVGAPGATDSSGEVTGVAYIFEENEGGLGNWGQVAKITENVNDNNAKFGFSVALEGDTAVIGSPEQHNNINEGAVYLYEANAGGTDAWGRVASPAPFSSNQGDHFGVGVAIYNGMLVVGANLSDDGGNKSGSAYILD